MLGNRLIICAQAAIVWLLLDAFLQISLGRTPLIQLHVSLSTQEKSLCGRFVDFERLISHFYHVFELFQVHVTIATILVHLNFQGTVVLRLFHLIKSFKPFRVAGNCLYKVLRFELFISFLFAFGGNLKKLLVI